jgi:hypothetical protein
VEPRGLTSFLGGGWGWWGRKASQSFRLRLHSGPSTSLRAERKRLRCGCSLARLRPGFRWGWVGRTSLVRWDRVNGAPKMFMCAGPARDGRIKLRYGYGRCRNPFANDVANPEPFIARQKAARLLEGTQGQAQDAPESSWFARCSRISQFARIRRWMFLAFVPKVRKNTGYWPRVLGSEAGAKCKTRSSGNKAPTRRGMVSLSRVGASISSLPATSDEADCSPH